MQFDSFVLSLGIAPEKRKRLLDWFLNYQREQLVPVALKSSEVVLNQYLDQVLDMFKNHKNLPDDVYKDYLKLVFEKCYLEIKGKQNDKREDVRAN